MSSELQEIIHRTMHLAFEQGRKAEREAIVANLTDYAKRLRDYNPISGEERAKMIEYAIERIEPSELLAGDDD